MAVDARTVHVALSERSYNITIGRELIGKLSEYLRLHSDTDHAVIVTDESVEGLYADAACNQLVEDGWEVDILVVPDGETSKSVEMAEDLWNALLNEGADRQSIIVAMGGGVVGDLAGFVAATFARGVDFFQVPTTLLAQVDSSVGGKVGVNLPGAKNMVGAFWQPKGVLVDVDVLQTLPDREYRAGLAEVVKYGVILDEPFFAFLEANVAPVNRKDAAVLATIVERCCRLKADVVENDERELSGLRAVLNYGHTFAHAFEALGDYTALLHGEAVAAGMRCAARLAQRLNRVDDAFVARHEALLGALNLLVPAPEVDGQELLRLMHRDKKVSEGRLRFVLPTKMGHVELVGDVRDDDVVAALKI